jgi:hypothetical protein
MMCWTSGNWVRSATCVASSVAGLMTLCGVACTVLWHSWRRRVNSVLVVPLCAADANMFVMQRKPTVLASLLESVCRHCRAFLNVHVLMGYRCNPNDASVMIDPRRIFQILTNGLSNAGKFTDRGQVLVDLVRSMVLSCYVVGCRVVSYRVVSPAQGVGFLLVTHAALLPSSVLHALAT